MAIAGCAFALVACGDSKKAPDKDAQGTAAPTEVKTEPPPDAPRSKLAESCETETDAAEKANCICSVSVLELSLSKELMAKLETVSKAETKEAALEHVGGMANVSKIYEAMRKAAKKCGNGAPQ